MQYKDPVAAKEMIVRLADYFQPHEFACPCCGRSLMDDELIMALDNLRHEFGGPLSIVKGGGYRCPAYNLKIKGAAKSYHMYGKAVDLNIMQFNGDRLHKLFRAVLTDYSGKGIARFNGLGVGGNKFHIDVRTIPTAWTY